MPLPESVQDVPTFRLLHTAAFFDPANPSPVAYPPFGAIQLGLLYGSGHPVTFFLLLALSVLGFAVWGVRRALVENGIDRWVALLFPLTLALVSFPIERLVVQGNIEIFLWIFTAAGVSAYLRDHDDVGGDFVGVGCGVEAVSGGPACAAFAAAQISCVLGWDGCVVAVFVLSLLYLGPDLAVAWKGSLQNVFGYQQFRGAELSTRELNANHSLFLLVKFAAAVLGISALTLIKSFAGLSTTILLFVPLFASNGSAVYVSRVPTLLRSCADRSASASLSLCGAISVCGAGIWDGDLTLRRSSLLPCGSV